MFEETTPELLNISYTESETGLPTLNINNELDITITNTTFLTAIIKDTLLKAYWRFNLLKTGKLSMSVDPLSTHHMEPHNVIVSLFLDSDFIGLTTVEELYSFATQAIATLKAIKVERLEDGAV